MKDKFLVMAVLTAFMATAHATEESSEAEGRPKKTKEEVVKVYEAALKQADVDAQKAKNDAKATATEELNGLGLTPDEVKKALKEKKKEVKKAKKEERKAKKEARKAAKNDKKEGSGSESTASSS